MSENLVTDKTLLFKKLTEQIIRDQLTEKDEPIDPNRYVILENQSLNTLLLYLLMTNLEQKPLQGDVEQLTAQNSKTVIQAVDELIESQQSAFQEILQLLKEKQN